MRTGGGARQSLRLLAAFLATMSAGAVHVAAGNEVAGRTVWSQGHFDVAVDLLSDGAWATDLKHEDFGRRTPESALLFVQDAPLPEGARISLPSGGTWLFTGALPGESFWFLPANEQPALLWPGIAAERTNPASLQLHSAGDSRVSTLPARWIFLDLLEVDHSGPGEGHVSLWISGTFGEPVVYWSTFAPPAEGNRWFINAGSHSHMNWGFSAPGVYFLKLRARSILTNGDPVESEPFTLTFVIGEAADPAHFAAWAALRFDAAARAAGAAAPSADPFSTDLANGLAFALGLEPHAVTAADFPQTAFLPAPAPASAFTYTFTRRGNLGGNMLRIEASPDLLEWETVSDATGTATWTSPSEGFRLQSTPGLEHEKVILETTAPGAQFLRLRVDIE